MLKEIFKLFCESHSFLSLLSNFREDKKNIKIYGVSRIIKLFLLNALNIAFEKPLVYISSNQFQVSQFVEEMRIISSEFFSEKREVIFFPDYEGIDDPYTASERLSFFSSMYESFPDKAPLIVAPVKSFLRLLPALSEADFSTLKITTGGILPMERVINKLLNMGYRKTDLVMNPGEFTRRGGIVDVYPPTYFRPVRIEWWGDDVEEVREFESSSQRSMENFDSIEIGPAREFICEREVVENGLERIKYDLRRRIRELKNNKKKDEAEFLEEKFVSKINGLIDGSDYSLFLDYPYYFFNNLVPAFDCLPSDIIVCMDEPFQIQSEIKSFQSEEKEMEYFRSEQGIILPRKKSLYLEWDDFTDYLKGSQIAELFMAHEPESDALPDYNFFPFWHIKEKFRGQIRLVENEIRLWLGEKRNVFVISRHSKRLSEMLLEDKIPLAPDNIREEGKVHVSRGYLPGGFVLPDYNMLILTDEEIFGKGSSVAPSRRKYKKVASVAPLNLADLDPGDYVVHEDYGIARYQGIEQLKIEGVSRDFIFLLFAKKDSLYIPVEQLNRVTKYIGGGDDGPRLSRMGTKAWKNVKRKVYKSVQDMADELIKLYAARQAAEGYSYPDDTEWMKQMEESFIYEETEDQVKSIADVKKDMMDRTPMDRLICGDVGYGKTEVAIRAAFKAMEEGKQVLMLVPTTVLAQQHYNTFLDRLAPYPFKIEMLSRFRSQKEQKKIVEDLKEGLVDMVIGTHRLLQKDLKVSDPGLLIIDEEQRFGVAHKEKLKALRASVDVLTLTATPIPRTLYMSLVGARDISVIETPPEGRLPVKTYLLKRSEKIIKEAISRELARGGQVFYLHNRVEDIESQASYLKSLFPGTRISIGHGQMDENELEQIMLDFVAGEFDILVCTTIIESGLDIPNANTLIVNHAERFGLSQLYQLRGRVGRSTRQAYAYLFYDPERALSENAFKRLEAISEFTDLGSGYKIAMKDLEIRGAGNLLGAEQHGFICQIGFELYCNLLAEAVENLKTAPGEKVPEAVIEVSVDAYIPDDYISYRRQKLAFYRRITKVNSDRELGEITSELEDRFGKLPGPVKNLITLARLRIFAKDKKVVRIKAIPPRITFDFFRVPEVSKRKFKHFSEETGLKIYMNQENQLVAIKEGLTPQEILELIEEILVLFL